MNTEVMDEKKRSWDEALDNEAWVAPVTDIYETEDEFILLAQMPGVSKDNVKIKLEDGNLIIMGRINFDEVKSRKYVLNESEIGNFYRKLKISDTIDEQKIDASLENGILKVELPKQARLKSKNIEIK